MSIAGNELDVTGLFGGAILSSVGGSWIVAGTSSGHCSGTFIPGTEPVAPRSPHAVNDLGCEKKIITKLDILNGFRTP